jgi:hypothetical protein
LKACTDKKIKEIVIKPRGNKNWKVPEDKIEEIETRRSKIEPIIGHLKKRGVGKSKNKVRRNDKTGLPKICIVLKSYSSAPRFK